jgi:hypothetical protein
MIAFPPRYVLEEMAAIDSDLRTSFTDRAKALGPPRSVPPALSTTLETTPPLEADGRVELGAGELLARGRPGRVGLARGAAIARSPFPQAA